MFGLSTNAVGTSPCAAMAAATVTSQCNGRMKSTSFVNSVKFELYDVKHMNLVAGGTRLNPVYTKRNPLHSCRKHSASITCAAAMDARCSASGQTQTVTREAPTITKVPVRDTTKSPELDDGGTGFPPGGDDDGGGGGGGGGGNWSGGFFFFGFLAFLGFLKDKESEEDYRK